VTGPDLYVRRLDDQLVEAIRFTGGNSAELARWTGLSFAVEKLPAGAWVVRDDARLYVVPSHEFWSHCRARPVE